MSVDPQSTLPEIPLREMGGEPRARDLDIAKQLGFERPRNIRKLIGEHAGELSAFGVCFAVEQTSGAKGGRPATEFWLNEEQALLIAALSEAPKAPMVRSMLIRTFVAWRRGHLAPISFDGEVTDLAPSVRAAIGGIMKGVIHREIATLLPAAVEAALLSDPRRAALDLVSVRQLLDEIKVPSKGRNPLNRRIGHALMVRALEMTGRGEPSPHRRCAHTGTWLYRRDFATGLMRDKGRGMIADHLAGLKGQSLLPLPEPPEKPKGGSGPKAETEH